MPHDTYHALAIDGGGTKCRLALLSDSGYESVVSGSANACSDFDGTVRSILSGVEQLADRLSLPEHAVRDQPAYMGIAGVVDPTIAERLRQALPFPQMKIEDDRRSALRGALGVDDGFVAHCGTGSFFAAQKSGEQKFVGGWGPLLDDIASAHWIGKRALTATLYAFDGLEEQSELTEALLKMHGDTASIVAYASHAPSAEIAQIARTVTQYAAQEDSNALLIMRQAASLIDETLQKLGWSEGKSICLTGGIGGHYKRYFSPAMQTSVVAAKAEPLDGAVALARDFLRELSN